MDCELGPAIKGWTNDVGKGGSAESSGGRTVVIDKIRHRDAEKGRFEAGVETCDSLTGYYSAGGVIGGRFCAFGFDLSSGGKGDEGVAVYGFICIVSRLERGASGGENCTYVKVMESRPPPAPARAWAMLSLSCCCARAATGAGDLAGEDILLAWK